MSELDGKKESEGMGCVTQLVIIYLAFHYHNLFILLLLFNL